MRLLALDTATLTASVALLVDGEVAAFGDVRVSTHSETLLPLVDDVLARGGVLPEQLDVIACGAGPGSFTGLRIGLSTAKGLAFALGKPLALVSSLAALAAAGSGLTLALIDAKKRELYAGLFRVSAEGVVPVGEEVVIAPGALAAHVAELAQGAAVVVVGDGAAAYPEVAAECGTVLVGARQTPDARWVARLALTAGSAATDAVPAYIRSSDADIATPNVPKRRDV